MEEFGGHVVMEGEGKEMKRTRNRSHWKRSLMGFVI